MSLPAPAWLAQSAQKVQGHWLWIISAGIFSLNFLLKGYGLTAVQIGLDEPFSIWYAHMQPAEIIQAFQAGNNPPLYEICLHYWMQLFGDSVLALRFPSLLAGCGTAVLLFWTGNRLRNGFVGLVAASIYTCMTELVYFSHEARVYAIWTMLCLLSIYVYLRLLAPDAAKGWGFLLILLNGLILLCHYFGIMILVVETAFWLFLPADARRRVRPWILGAWALLLFTLFQIRGNSIWVSHHASTEHWVGTANWAGIFNVFAKYCNQPLTAVAALVVLALGGWALGRQRENRADPRFVLIALLFPGCYIAFFLLGMRLPIFLDRYVAFTIPGLCLGLAMSLDLGLQGKWRLLGATLLVALFAFTLQLKPDKHSQWREVAAWAQTEQQPKTQFLILPYWNQLAFAYFYHKDWFDLPSVTKPMLRANGIFGIARYTRPTSLRLQEADKVWVIAVGEFQSQIHPALDSVLQADFVDGAADRRFRGIQLLPFARRQD